MDISTQSIISQLSHITSIYRKPKMMDGVPATSVFKQAIERALSVEKQPGTDTRAKHQGRDAIGATRES